MHKYIIVIVYALYFFTGVTGLIYQVLWQTKCTHLWGSASTSVAVVIGSFLLGLGFGARVAGHFADRIRHPLMAYGVLEISVGLLAALVLMQFDWLHQLPVLGLILGLDPGMKRTAAQFLTSAIMLVPPSMMMGATLPVLSTYVAKGLDELPSVVGVLYFLNTVGAAIGVLAAGFFLLPLYGLQSVYWSTIAANIIIGLVAITVDVRSRLNGRVSWRAKPAHNMKSEGEHVQNAPLTPPVNGVATCAFVFGVCAIVMELVWTRQLAMMVGSSTYAFSAMLFVVLLGLGVGGLVYRLFCCDYNGRTVLYVLLIALIASIAIGEMLVPILTRIVGALRTVRVSSLGNAVCCIAVSGVLEFVPSVLMGIYFPCLIKLVRQRTIGNKVGRIFAWNTAGAMVGSLITFTYLIPTIGLQKTIACVLMTYLAMNMMVIMQWQSRLQWLVNCSIILVACVMIVGGTSPHNPMVTEVGQFMYGEAASNGRVLYHRAGAASNVLVVDQGVERTLRVNGKVDASMRGDMKMQLSMAYYPILLHNDPKQILVIGFGSGASVGTAALCSSAQVTCVELEENVILASKHFDSINHHPLESQRVECVIGDGRSYVSGTKKQYDIIMSEPSNPWIAGVSNLFTKEYYHAAQEKLTSKGIYAQWLQMYSFTLEEYAMVLNTIMDVFEYCAIIRISSGDTILVASMESLTPKMNNMKTVYEQMLNNEEIAMDAALYFQGNIIRSLCRDYVTQLNGIKIPELNTDRSMINTDRNMRLEYLAPLSLFRMDNANDRLDRLILKQYDETAFVGRIEYLTPEDQNAVTTELIQLMLSKGVESKAVSLANAVRSEYPGGKSDMLLVLANEKMSNDDLHSVLSVKSKSDLKIMLQTSKKLHALHRYDDAIAVLERAYEIQPDSPSIIYNLSINYIHIGRLDEAASMYQRSNTYDPFNMDRQLDYETHLKNTTYQLQGN